MTWTRKQFKTENGKDAAVPWVKLITRVEKRAERAHKDKHTLKLGAYKASDVVHNDKEP